MPAALFGIFRSDGVAVDDHDVRLLVDRLDRYGPAQVHRLGPTAVVGRCGPERTVARGDGAVVVADGRFSAADSRRAICRAVERAGGGAFGLLDGDGAFVQADARSGRCVAAVDHVASSPLHWSRPARGCVVVASQADALPGVCGTPDHPDEAHLVDRITGLMPAPDATDVAAVRRIPEGHALVVDGAGPRLQRWWRFESRPVDWRAADAAIALREAVARAVDDRLPDDGPIALELSGGLDSSAIAALAAGSVRRRGRPLLTYSYAPVAERGWSHVDELPFARAVLSTLDPPVAHTVVRRGDRPAPDHVVTATLGFVPFTRTSLLAAGEAGATVLLSGWGGDHIVTDHAGPALPGMFLAGQWSALWRDLRAGDGLVRSSPVRTAARFAHLGGQALRDAARLRGGLPDRAVTDDTRRYLTRCCLRPDVAARFDVARRLQATDRAGLDLHHRRRVAIEGRILSQRIEGERLMSVRTGVDLRYPLLDRTLLELAATFPLDLWHRDGWSRWLFREAVRGVLPEPVRLRRDKLGGTSDSALAVSRTRDRLIARAEAVHADPAARDLIDTGALLAQLRAVPAAATLRDLPGHGDHHPALQRRGALLRALGVGELLARHGGRR